MGDPLEEDVEPVDEVAQALENGFRPGRWWQAISLDGTVQAETSNPADFVELGLFDKDDIRFYHQYIRSDEEWVKETPRP